MLCLNLTYHFSRISITSIIAEEYLEELDGLMGEPLKNKQEMSGHVVGTK
jgi:hypothetical protein